MVFGNNDQSIHEPYELRQLEEKFQLIGPRAKKENGFIIFYCRSKYYNDNIGYISEPLSRDMAMDSLKIRAKYAFYKILLKDRKIKTCHCGKILFKPKPWVDVCHDCMKGK